MPDNSRSTDPRTSANSNESFIRWQGRTIQQLGAFNNLLIGLATGLVAFQTQLAFNEEVNLLLWETQVMVCSMGILFLSIFAGCYLAWNRLIDFRNTAHVARHRGEKQYMDIKDLRDFTDYLGRKTWFCIRLQYVAFLFGSLFLIAVTVGQYMG
jgi:hypothetical protein